jgi:hypothetical protein
VIFLGDFSFVKIFLKNYCVTTTTTLNTSRSENTMVLSARVSACMYFLVILNSVIIHVNYNIIYRSLTISINFIYTTR